jgi:hypothetical protein
MIDRLWPFLEELRQTFRIADAFDIALISLFLYGMLIWFRTTASRSLAIGFSVLATLYLQGVAQARIADKLRTWSA